MGLNRWQRALVFLSVLFVYNERGGVPPGHSWTGEIVGFVVPMMVVYAIVLGVRWVIFDPVQGKTGEVTPEHQD